MTTPVTLNPKDLLKEVILRNRGLQTKAREINTRAGEEVFPVLNTNQWQERLRPFLLDAVSVATIPDIAILRLPELETAMIELVIQENPDVITVLDHEMKIQYRQGYVPTGALQSEDMQAPLFRWRELPDEGVKLPGGRLVALSVYVSSWENETDSDIPNLKEKLRMRLNSKQWDEWKDRPELSKPSPEDDNAEFTCRAEAVYGKCVVTDQPLLAYGVIGYESDYYRGSGFKTMWFRPREEADKAFESAKVVFERQQAEARERRVLEAVRTAAQQVKDNLDRLYGEHHYNSELTEDLRHRLYERRNQYLPSTAAELKQWAVDTEAIIAEVEAAAAEVLRRKVEAAAQQRKLAYPILRFDEQENDSTVYAMPCNDEGPCDVQTATSWQLYSLRGGDFVRHKGFRSQSYGTTLAELVSDYLRGEPDLAQILNKLPAWSTRRPKLDPVREAVGGDPSMAQYAQEFAEAAKNSCGGKVELALRILEGELNAPYGRARRQDAIQRNLPGIGNSEAGQRFLGHGRASDVDATLAGAVAWLESQTSSSQPKQKEEKRKEEPQQTSAVKPAGGSLDALSKAWGAKLKK